jgi:ABC-2 type transport system ATP-binding protein
MITINNLCKTYGNQKIIAINLLEIKEGELIGLVGNNGAGKTTLLRLILDLVQADSGTIISNGMNVVISENWKYYTAAYLDEGFLIDYLTPKEYLYFCGKLQGFSTTTVDDFVKSVDSFLGNEVFDGAKYIRDLSRGNQSKVGIVSCLLQKPQVLILDEPFANLDPTSQIQLKKILTHLQQQHKTTCIISSHDINHITDISSRILLIERGQIIKDIKTETDTLQELIAYFKV